MVFPTTGAGRLASIYSGSRGPQLARSNRLPLLMTDQAGRKQGEAFAMRSAALNQMLNERAQWADLLSRIREREDAKKAAAGGGAPVGAAVGGAAGLAAGLLAIPTGGLSLAALGAIGGLTAAGSTIGGAFDKDRGVGQQVGQGFSQMSQGLAQMDSAQSNYRKAKTAEEQDFLRQTEIPTEKPLKPTWEAETEAVQAAKVEAEKQVATAAKGQNLLHPDVLETLPGPYVRNPWYAAA